MTLLFRSGKSVKDKVIITLGTVWPLSQKGILTHIRQNLGGNITYQAVHKSINELAEEDIIVKTSSGFMLNREWLCSLKEYILSAEQSYKTGTPENATTDYKTVDSIWDWYIYILMTLEKFLNDQHATKVPSYSKRYTHGMH